MNTEQKYPGRGNSASPVSPMVNSGPQASSLIDDRQTERITEIQKEILDLVDDFFFQAPASNWLGMLTDYYNYWSIYILDANDRDYDPYAQYQVQGGAIDRTFSLFRLMCFITALSDAQNKVEFLEKKAGNQ